jgi:protein O-GlcNAc transferase
MPINTIMNLVNSKKYEEAIILGLNILSKDSTQPDTANLVGMAFLECNMPLLAAQYFQIALRSFEQLKNREVIPHVGAIYAGHFGKALAQLGRTEEARRCYEHSLKLSHLPNVKTWLDEILDPVEIDHALAIEISADDKNKELQEAVSIHRMGYFAEAEKRYRALLEKAQIPDALHLLGMTCYAQGRSKEAEYLIQRALEMRPNAHEYHCNLGNVVSEMGRKDEAIQCYKKALELQPDFVDPLLNIGKVLHEIGKAQEALEYFEKLNATNKRNAHTLIAHGQALFDIGLKDKARELWKSNHVPKEQQAEYKWHQTILEICGNYASVEEELSAFKNYSSKLIQMEKSVKKMNEKELLAMEPIVGTAQPFYLTYLAQDDRDIQKCYGNIMGTIMQAWQKKKGYFATENHKVDVLFISGHIRDHSVWNAFLKGYILTLKDAGIKTAAFYTDRKIDDNTIDARGLFDYFVQGPKPFETWVQGVCEFSPKIIIYPEVGMDPTTVRLASLRLAPLQATAWGHPSTTGLPTIDYYLSGEWLEPANGQDHYSEKLVLLGHHGATYAQLTPKEAKHNFAQIGLRPEATHLLLPHSPFKLLPSHDYIWIEIAKIERDVQLVFFDNPAKKSYSNTVKERLRIQCEQAGIDFEQRFIFIPWLGRSSLYSLFGQSALYLDSIGFSGFNTAMQATECGLPVLAYEGKQMRGRLASSINRALNLDELVVNTHEEFIAKTKMLVEFPEKLEDYKEKIISGRDSLYNRQEPAQDFMKFIQSALNQDI